MLWPSVRRPGWLRMNSQTLPQAGHHAEPTAPGATSRRIAGNLRGQRGRSLTANELPDLAQAGPPRRANRARRDLAPHRGQLAGTNSLSVDGDGHSPIVNQE